MITHLDLNNLHNLVLYDIMTNRYDLYDLIYILNAKGHNWYEAPMRRKFGSKKFSGHLEFNLNIEEGNFVVTVGSRV